MVVYWMPYLRLAYPIGGPREHNIGKAIFFEDSAATWQTELGRTRPEFLEIYREFPYLDRDENTDPLFGTLVRSDDTAWLDEHIDAAVSIVYFLGDPPRRGRPAECFAYERFTIRSPELQDTSLVSFWTKHGRLTESSHNLKLYPPLGARGNTSPYALHSERTELAALLKRFSANPDDRVVVAVRQYFRTQFTDIFTSPYTQDFALQCGAIEAALNIDALSPGVSDRFVENLTQLFGDDGRYADFFLGLYAARSVFVHGAAAPAKNASGDALTAAYRMFNSIRGKATVLRAVTREVILHALGQKPHSFRFWNDGSASSLLATVLNSTTTWQRTRSLLTRRKSADKIMSMNESEFAKVETLSQEIAHYFSWECVDDAHEQQVFDSICTCAIVIGRLTSSTGDVYAESDGLGKAADRTDREAIQQWILKDPWHRVGLVGGRLPAMQSIMRELAKFFDQHRIVQ